MVDELKAIGVTGLSIWRGIINEEYLNQLKGTKRWKIFREMEDDATIGTLQDAILLPLLASEFFVDPASDAGADTKAADFVYECMSDLTGSSWRQHVINMMSAPTYGFALAEIVMKKRMGNLGKPSSKYNDGKIGIHSLDPRAQDTVEEWLMDEEQHVTGIKQRDPNTGAVYNIPIGKLIHWPFRPKKRNPEGSSIMRSLYRAWYMRKNLEIVEGIGIERDLAGLPVIKLPYGANKSDSDVALAIVRNMRNDEEAGVVLPPPPQSGNDVQGWEIELLGGGNKAYDTRQTIQDYDKKILMRYMAQFLVLGMGNVGTQSLVEGSQDFFGLVLKAVQQELLEIWNAQLIPLLFTHNTFDGMTGLPVLNWADPGKQDVAALSTLVKDLVGVKVITPESGLEDHIRSVAGLPDRPEGMAEGERIQALNTAPPPFQKQYADIRGTDGRDGEDPKARLANEYQGKLLAMYDEWSNKIADTMKNATIASQLPSIFESYLPELAGSMKALAGEYIPRAVKMGAKTDDIEVQALIKERLESNADFIDTSLIPDLRVKMVHLFEQMRGYDRKDFAFDTTVIVGALFTMRARVGSYSGQVWFGIFAGAKLSGKREDKDRIKQGNPPRRVRWILDPLAEHCQERPGHFGCPDLAHEYPSWDSLPTVPGGQVSCLGNCRCRLEVETDKGWWAP